MYRVSDSSRVEDGLLDGLKKLLFGGGKEKTAYSKGDRIKFERENGQRASGIILGALVDLNDKSICYAVQSSATLDPVVVDEDSIIGKNNKGDKKSRGGDRDRDRDDRTDRSSRSGRSRWVDDSKKVNNMRRLRDNEVSYKDWLAEEDYSGNTGERGMSREYDFTYPKYDAEEDARRNNMSLEEWLEYYIKNTEFEIPWYWEDSHIARMGKFVEVDVVVGNGTIVEVFETTDDYVFVGEYDDSDL